MCVRIWRRSEEVQGNLRLQYGQLTLLGASEYADFFLTTPVVEMVSDSDLQQYQEVNKKLHKFINLSSIVRTFELIKRNIST